MNSFRVLMSSLLVVSLVASSALAGTAQSAAQGSTQAEVWRDFAATLTPGARVIVQQADGPRVKATLLQVAPDHITVAPRTRIPVPPQRLTFDDIRLLEIEEVRSTPVGKTIAVGVVSGVGAFLGMLLVLFASISD